MRYGGASITEDEALGVARRLARTFNGKHHLDSGRTIKAMADVEEWPSDSIMTQAAWRLPKTLLFRVRARAEMEGITVSEVVREALEAYASASPGSRVSYPRPKIKGTPRGRSQ